MLPNIEASHIVAWLGELGWCGAAGMGIAPLSAVEVLAWAALTDTQMQPWEYRALRSASVAYVAQTNTDTPAPPYELQELHKPPVAGAFSALAKRINAR